MDLFWGITERRGPLGSDQERLHLVTHGDGLMYIFALSGSTYFLCVPDSLFHQAKSESRPASITYYNSLLSSMLSHCKLNVLFLALL